MNVHKAGRHDLSAGVDFLYAPARDVANFRNHPIRNSDVTLEAFGACTVYDRSAAQDQIVRHDGFPPVFLV
jgi:hypothetical protein